MRPVSYPQLPSDEFRTELADRLLAWFEYARRSLPWRQTRDPYAIWLSEIMLQQTQVATVIPYFHRFLNAFPTIADLARAEEQHVLKLWEGLGYYRRARSMHQAARILVRDHQGVLPPSAEVVAQLPGIGRYTLGAILSQAFDLPWPIVEANSQRVLARLADCRAEVTQADVREWIWDLAEQLVPEHRAGEFNQALMELGSLVCTVSKPLCDECPLAQSCAARKANSQDEIPVKPAKPAVTHVQELAIVLQRGASVLLVQRPGEGRWATLWEFPHGASEQTTAQAGANLLTDLTGYLGTEFRALTTLQHSVTRWRIRLNCWLAQYRRGRFTSSFYQRAKWVTLNDLTDHPLSAPQRRLAQALPKQLGCA